MPLIVCLMTCPQPLPQPVLHTVRSSASSFNLQYPVVFLRSSSSCLRLFSRLRITFDCHPWIMCFRRQFVRLFKTDCYNFKAFFSFLFFLYLFCFIHFLFIRLLPQGPADEAWEHFNNVIFLSRVLLVSLTTPPPFSLSLSLVCRSLKCPLPCVFQTWPSTCTQLCPVSSWLQPKSISGSSRLPHRHCRRRPRGTVEDRVFVACSGRV